MKEIICSKEVQLIVFKGLLISCRRKRFDELKSVQDRRREEAELEGNYMRNGL